MELTPEGKTQETGLPLYRLQLGAETPLARGGLSSIPGKQILGQQLSGPSISHWRRADAVVCGGPE